MHDSAPHLDGLLAAVAASPDDVSLRLHLAEELLAHGRAAQALEHCSAVLSLRPEHARGLELLSAITAAMAAPPAPPGFDWTRAEREVGGPEPVAPRGDPVTEDVAEPRVTLADVAGMEQVKKRLEVAFLGPMRRPDMAAAFGKSTSGGLLLYGPPGCGKTYVARALAGQLGAKFLAVGITDVLDAYVGDRERHLAEMFAAARRDAPCVLFFDEVDALGQKRSHLKHDSWLRTVVNTLLTEMDSVRERNDGVFVLGATNHPWDVDTALRRPGRFDRMVLVLPPDATARAALLRLRLADRPRGDLDIDRLVSFTQDFSGADLAHLVDSAAELALADSMVRGEVRPIAMDDFAAALREVKPSCGPWLQTARNVTTFGNTDGSYDDLRAYLKQRRLL
ncbi:MAG TPA: AAA family ATPase [Stackebrandtia sp.]|jgi:SpoVK/Ycf46/Vps4 family AAA+-type ATPase|uniref:AAA family ATPase n=1 Tax=Stackebrandtia sp. TaxID=2023065 RepID=UPI002D43A484|nr:AAA family ATPase [Stackebrandtia sp.]HZE40217.1 AAA family ATPase [Stackebrandtia sp.]